MSPPEMVTLPHGVIVYVGNRRYRSAIPANVCPKKFRASDKPAPKPAKPDSKTGEARE